MRRDRGGPEPRSVREERESVLLNTVKERERKQNNSIITPITITTGTPATDPTRESTHTHTGVTRQAQKREGRAFDGSSHSLNTSWSFCKYRQRGSYAIKFFKASIDIHVKKQLCDCHEDIMRIF